MNTIHPIKIVICDDNSEHLKRIRGFLNNTLTEIAVKTIETFAPEELLKRLEQRDLSFDIAVMDIDFSGSDFNGIDLANKINIEYPKCQIIYLTSYIQFAPKVYDTTHVYYVMKNEMAEYLPKAVIKAYGRLLQTPAVLDFIYQGQRISIPFSSLYYIEKQKGLKRSVIFTSFKNYDVNLSLKELEAYCKTSALIRCHHSFLINPESIVEFRNTSVLMKNQQTIPIGRTFQKHAKQAYLNYLDQKMHTL